MRIKELKWIRKNLFATVLDTLVTLTIVALLAWLVPKILGWALFDANFVGVTREDCKSGGACWVFIGQRWRQFIYGFYPEGQHWRINVSGLILAAWAVAWRYLPSPRGRTVWPWRR